MVLQPARNGGVSFLLQHGDEVGRVDFWTYICPLDAEFSSKQAVKTLRTVVQRGIKPWGCLKLKGDVPLLDQLTENIIGADGPIPTGLNWVLWTITKHNEQQELRCKAEIEKRARTLNIYEDN
jgi:hypothetical protein